MKTIFLYLALFVLTFSAEAFDEYNSLRWNRKNHEANNGKIDTGPWFEWWYYKVVLPETDDSFYFVYGVVNPRDREEVAEASRSYVGVGNFKEQTIIDSVYSVSDFNASYKKTFVRIRQNFATDTRITGTVMDKDKKPVIWNIKIKPVWKFNAMGWSMHVPELCNIYWYPAQADALFSGEIFFKGKLYRFENAPGYQDRNWGRSFPDWWTWIVSNNFTGHPESALAIGGGRPEILNNFKPVDGVEIGLKHRGKIYAFRPNDFDRVNVNIDFGVWEVKAQNLFYKIEVSAWAPPGEFMDIQFLTPAGEIFHDYETLTGTLDVKLYRRDKNFNWELFEILHSEYAGIEYGSRDVYNLNQLFSEQRTLL